MKFGNWMITETGIEWAGDEAHRFVIEKSCMLDAIVISDADQWLYKYIVLATQETWLQEDDLYDLNFAFAFAAGALPENQQFHYKTFDDTLEYQFNLMDAEEEEDGEEE